MKFSCPSCGMHLMAEAEMAGQIVRCPGCNLKFQIPAAPSGDVPAPNSPSLQPRATSPGQPRHHPSGQPQERKAWKEEDPTNPPAKISFGVGLGLTFVWFIIVYFFQAPAGKPESSFTASETFANLFYKHFTISFLNVMFFFWAVTILYLKLQKLKHQREALLLDVLPVELGKEINGGNVASFIDNLYKLPIQLRDSLMVNRIRKALELFEVRQNVPQVNAMMQSQSAIDGSRIAGSYIMVRAFLWAIPLLGFIGTVIGLSHAIGGLNFGSDVQDVSKLMGSISAVTSGLGTAFDATLLGLILAVGLNFPLNSMAKHEDETLNDIDAFCNEVLIPRLNDGSGAGGGDVGAVGDSVVKAIAGAQKEFLTDLNTLSARMLEYADSLDQRTAEHQQVVTHEFVTQMSEMRAQVENAMTESMRLTALYLSGLESGLQGLNGVLEKLGEKQVVVQQVKKKGWFGRSKD